MANDFRRRALTPHPPQARKDGNDGYDPYAGLPSDSDEESSGEERDPYALPDDDEGPTRESGRGKSDSAQLPDNEDGESDLEEGFVKVEAPDISKIDLS